MKRPLLLAVTYALAVAVSAQFAQFGFRDGRFQAPGFAFPLQQPFGDVIAQTGRDTGKDRRQSDQKNDKQTWLDWGAMVYRAKDAGNFAYEKGQEWKAKVNDMSQKIQQGAATLMNSAFKNLPPQTQTLLEQMLRDAGQTAQSSAGSVERMGRFLTESLNQYDMTKDISNIPEDVFRDVADWMRNENESFQSNPDEAFVDAMFTASWILFKLGLMDTPQALWGPILKLYGFSSGGIKKGSIAWLVQRIISPVVRRGLFATSQSAGQGGYGSKVFNNAVRYAVGADLTRKWATQWCLKNQQNIQEGGNAQGVGST